ncbi:hypothetical protein LIER_34104 [Lithospermum erythrorhizon]|uniref:Uncharacterized protein n=1 Tax=Lithospermum erythrorhizon TaxID=34254 RepID=A0AAV3RYJ2_LITER
MNIIKILSCFQLPIWLFFSILLQSVSPGLGDSSSSSNSKNETEHAGNHSSRTSTWTYILIVCLGLAILAFSVILFKIWQKKKRAEQQARLLRLFEDDDELEVELGIRD